MKTSIPLKNQLGLSQDEMATLLQINASQWSMYKSGKRALPLPATKQLASILLHLQSAKATSKERAAHGLLEQRRLKEWLEKEQQNIIYQKQLLDRKKRILENKRTECFAALEVISFLETQPGTIPAIVLEDMKTRVLKTLDAYSLVKLKQLEMKEEGLVVLEKGLIKRMGM